MGSGLHRELIRGRAAQRRLRRLRRLRGTPNASGSDWAARFLGALKALLGTPPGQGTGKSTLLFSSSVLLEARAACLQGPDEELLLVEGYRLDPTTGVVSRLLRPAYARQGLVGVVAEPLSVRDLVVGMHERGHCLACIFHSHPGSGLSATLPSVTDRATQERYELGGGICIGGIFSRGNLTFLRFFSVRTRFRVLVYGDGIKEVKKNVFQFAKETAVQAPPPGKAQNPRLVVVR